MLWFPQRSWAPHFVVTVRSQPHLLIESVSYCILACFVFLALLIRTVNSSRTLKAHSFRPISSPSSGRVEIAEDDSFSDAVASEFGHGDASGAEVTPPKCWSDVPPAVPSSAPSAAPCPPSPRAAPALQGPRGALVGEVGVGSEATSLLCDRLVDDDQLGGDSVVLSVEEDAPFVNSMSCVEDDDDDVEEDGDAAEVTVPEHDDEDRVAAGCGSSMVDYVTARYQGLRKAALAGRLPANSQQGTPLWSLSLPSPRPPLAESTGSDLVTILANALGRSNGVVGREQTPLPWSKWK